MGDSTIKYLLTVSCLVFYTQCVREQDVTGLYKPSISTPGAAEWLVVEPDNTYRYHYIAHHRHFTNRGSWQLETSNGYTYLQMNSWRMIKPPGTVVSRRKPSIASFVIDGKSIAIINDLPDCTYDKQEKH